MNKNLNLTEGSIEKNLFLLALPIIAGTFLHSVYNIVDTFFIGMLGSNELAAVSVTFPVVFVFIAFVSGLGVGTSALISQAVGAKKIKDASNIAEHSLILATIFGISIAILGLLFSAPLFEFMGATGEILGLTLEYSNLIFIGFVFMFIGFISQSILQAQGNAKTPMKNLVVSVVINIILDPIFIFGFAFIPSMGLAGAAIATIIARSIGASLNLLALVNTKTIYCFDFSCFKPDFSVIKRIVFIGFPASLSQTINSIGMMFLLSIVGVFGAFALAAYGVGLRIDSIAVMPLVGLTQATIAMSGQNLGAGFIDRMKKTIKTSIFAGSVISLIFMVLFIVFSSQIYSIFTSELEVISIGSAFLFIIAFSFVPRAINYSLIAAFQSAKRTDLGMFLNALNWGIIICSAYFLQTIYGLTGVWVSIIIGTASTTLVAAIIYKRGNWLKRD